MKRYWILLVLIAFVAVGCKPRVVTQPDTGKMDQQQDMSQAQKGPQAIPEQKIASADEDVKSKYMTEKSGMFEDVLFDFDKYNIKDEFKPILKSVSSWMMKNPDAALSVEGHCDERGTNEYNLALGERRAKAVKDYLVSLGVSSAKIGTISYGEEKSLCMEQNESCWSKNRRAHFVVLTQGK